MLRFTTLQLLIFDDRYLQSAERFGWVAGVAGNHDDVSQVPGLAGKVHLLDGNVVTLDEIRIGGIGGIIGNKAKPGRRPEHVQLAHVDRAVGTGLDVLVLLGLAKATPAGRPRQTRPVGEAKVILCLDSAASTIVTNGVPPHWPGTSTRFVSRTRPSTSPVTDQAERAPGFMTRSIALDDRRLPSGSCADPAAAPVARRGSSCGEGQAATDRQEPDTEPGWRVE